MPPPVHPFPISAQPTPAPLHASAAAAAVPVTATDVSLQQRALTPLLSVRPRGHAGGEGRSHGSHTTLATEVIAQPTRAPPHASAAAAAVAVTATIGSLQQRALTPLLLVWPRGHAGGGGACMARTHL